jgi:hypothetical protein
MMFRVSFFCDDKKLANALRGLAGIAMAPGPIAEPVINAEAKGGKIVAVTNGSKLELLADYLSKHKIVTFTPKEAMDSIVPGIGMAKSSTSYLLKRATEARIVKRNGKGNKATYTVNAKAGAS